MRSNERFLTALKDMNAAVKEDYANGKTWKYTNTKKREKTFSKARSGNRLTNCVDAVQMGLRTAGIPASALDWYGAKGKIAWCSTNAKENAKKYFDIISVKNKTVNKLLQNGDLCDGDILTYVSMAHTNVYYGKDKSFDAGASEGATFKKWIKSLKWGSSKVAYILRLKDRAHYRVQAGAYTNLPKFNEQAAIVRSKGFPVTMIEEDGMYKVQCGYFSGKTNADKLVSALQAKGISAFAKEV